MNTETLNQQAAWIARRLGVSLERARLLAELAFAKVALR